VSQEPELSRDGAPRARRHPWAIALVWAWEAAVALVVAWPAATLARRAYGGDPRGDAVLWDAGAHPLMALATRDAHGVSVVFATAVLVLGGAAIASVVPTAGLLAALARTGDARRGSARSVRVAAATARCLPAFGVLLASFAVAQGCVAFVAWIVGRIASAVASGSLGDAHAQLVGAGVTALGLIPLAALSLTHDLARAAVAGARARAGASVLLAAGVLRAAWASLGWAWAWRWAAGWGLVGCGAVLAVALAGRGPMAVLALAFAHQLVALARVALRASWLARALHAMAQVAARPR
jgi:hypothetical protein